MKIKIDEDTVDQIMRKELKRLVKDFKSTDADFILAGFDRGLEEYELEDFKENSIYLEAAKTLLTYYSVGE